MKRIIWMYPFSYELHTYYTFVNTYWSGLFKNTINSWLKGFKVSQSLRQLYTYSSRKRDGIWEKAARAWIIHDISFAMFFQVSIIVAQVDPDKEEKIKFYFIADIFMLLNFALDPYVYVVFRRCVKYIWCSVYELIEQNVWTNIRCFFFLYHSDTADTNGQDIETFHNKEHADRWNKKLATCQIRALVIHLKWKE
jgi:hypothetical protein